MSSNSSRCTLRLSALQSFSESCYCHDYCLPGLCFLVYSGYIRILIFYISMHSMSHRTLPIAEGIKDLWVGSQKSDCSAHKEKPHLSSLIQPVPLGTDGLLKSLKELSVFQFPPELIRIRLCPYRFTKTAFYQSHPWFPEQNPVISPSLSLWLLHAPCVGQCMNSIGLDTLYSHDFLPRALLAGP